MIKRTAVTMKKAVFWDIKPSSYLTGNILLPRYIATGFHGGDYEECRLLGYNNPVRTSQEILIISYRAQPVNAI
jgi:hypothetical protein